MSDITGITFSEAGTLRDWQVIHDRWVAELSHFIDITKLSVVPYIHAEHGNTTQLAIAASKAGYAATRELLGGRRDGKQGARLDLCVISKTTVDLIEAKFCEFELGSTSANRIISEQLKQASAQINGYDNENLIHPGSNRVTRHVAIVYIAPFAPKEGSFDDAQITSLIEDIKKDFSPDLLSWNFPEICRSFIFWNRFYPGIILLAKVLG